MKNKELTKREIETLLLVAKGYSNNQIAKELYISIHTVKAHLEKIYYKFKVHNKVQAAIVAVTKGLIDIKELY